MSEFFLNPKLAEDSFLIKELTLCEVRLFNNANFPWFLLIPRKPHLIEIFDLSFEERIKLFEEVNQFAKQLKQSTHCDKINIATIGNVVSQLHIHVIARFVHDAAWPKPVWGTQNTPYVDKSHAVAYWQEQLSVEKE